MEQILPRGYRLNDGNRIKKLIVDADAEWQIYSTSSDSLALIATRDVMLYWENKFSLPKGTMRLVDETNMYLFVGKKGCLISSVNNGPFPEDYGQIRAFAAAFNTFTKLYPDTSLFDAVYIEELSLLLPRRSNTQYKDSGNVFGTWITGGVDISVRSFERLSQLMSWLPKSELTNAVKIAGFECDKIGVSFAENPVRISQRNSHSGLPQERFELVGRPELEAFINDNIIDIIKNLEKYKKMGIHFPGATVFYGPPGCGKTYAVDKLSEYLGWKKFYIDANSIASSYIHETSKKISEVFNAAIAEAPSIIVIDEMEAFLSNRSVASSLGIYHNEEVAEFLRQIPEAVSKNVLIFAMTNMLDAIDPAVLRRGRFDYIIEVKPASSDEIEMMLLNEFKNLPINGEVDARFIAERLKDRPLSDVSFVLREAGKYAVKSNKIVIDNECFTFALEMLPKSTQKRSIGFSSDNN